MESLLISRKEALRLQEHDLRENAREQKELEENLKGLEEKKEALRRTAREAGEEAQEKRTSLAALQAVLKGQQDGLEYTTKEEAAGTGQCQRRKGPGGSGTGNSPAGGREGRQQKDGDRSAAPSVAAGTAGTEKGAGSRKRGV